MTSSVVQKYWMFVFIVAVLAIVFFSTRAKKASKSFDLVFLWDTSFWENYLDNKENPILEDNGYDYSLENFKGFLNEADLVLANLETPLTTLKNSPHEWSKDYIHYSDPKESIKSFKKHNISIVWLANNHTLDYWLSWLVETLDSLDAAWLESFWAWYTKKEASKPIIKEIAVGGRTQVIAIITAFEENTKYRDEYNFYADTWTPWVNPIDMRYLEVQIADLFFRYQDPYVIVFPHWGSNYKYKNAEQVIAAQSMIDAGASLIVWHGAHMAQEVERRAKNDDWKRVVYSLWNFMFNSPWRYESSKVQPFSMVAKLHITKDKKELHLYPIFTDNKITNYQSRFLTDEEFEDFLILNLITPKEKRISNKDKYGNYIKLDI